MRLSGAQFNQLWEAMRDAYKRSTLEQMLYSMLDKRLDEVSLGEDFKEIVYQLLQDAERKGYTLRLLAAAREWNPGNPLLLAVSQHFGLSAAPPDLEKKVRAEVPFVDVARWRRRLGEVEICVCRVETPGGTGTGFLVGTSTVITNFHVLEGVIAGHENASHVVFRFDYKRSADGAILNPGRTFPLSGKDWLIDYSPYNAAEGVGDENAVPGVQELDYALVRVDGDPGAGPVNALGSDPAFLTRGFVQIPTTAAALQANAPILIIQHPADAPLKLGLETNAVVDYNVNRTRVRYRTNTEPGSSGSPCFDINWNLVAIHHAGDPTAKPSALAMWNRGIPIDTIRGLIANRGFAGELG